MRRFSRLGVRRLGPDGACGGAPAPATGPEEPPGAVASPSRAPGRALHLPGKNIPGGGPDGRGGGVQRPPTRDVSRGAV